MPASSPNSSAFSAHSSPGFGPPLLVVDHLTMRFGGLVAVNDVSFQVAKGGITALIGPNGAGKTTVFNCITGFYCPTEGRIALTTGPDLSADALDRVTGSSRRHIRDGSHQIFLLERMPGHEITAQARVARTFQNIRLFTGMTCLENLLVAQHNALMRASGYTLLGLFGSPSWRRAEDYAVERARAWLDRIGLPELAAGIAARYGRSAVKASKMSATVMMRVSSAIWSPLRPRG